VSGLEVLKQLQSQRRPKVLIVSMHPEARFAIRTLKLGAAGYMTKDCAPEELVEAIRRIHRGGRFISPELAELLAFDLMSGQPQHQRLSEREMEVFLGIGAGKKTTEIAQELGLTVATVHTYRTRIFEKMNFSSNADLVRYALENDLLD
jgi:DNA-binding NarL/FixJ family response regulator